MSGSDGGGGGSDASAGDSSGGAAKCRWRRSPRVQVSSVVSVLLCVAAAPGRVGYGVSAFPKAFLLLINTKISSRNNYFKINSTD